MFRLALLLLLLGPAHGLTMASKKGELGDGRGMCDRKGEFARNWRLSVQAVSAATHPLAAGAALTLATNLKPQYLDSVHSGENPLAKFQNEGSIKAMHNFWSVVEPDANFMNAGLAEPGFKLNKLPEIKTRSALMQGTMFATLQKHGQSLYRYAATHFLEEGALKGKDILEVGMGKGIGAAYLSQAFGPKSVEGIDLTEGHIALAKAFFPSSDSLQFMQGNAEHLKQASDSKDFVFDLDNAHMYSHPDKALSEAFRVLKPGGKYIYASALPGGRSLAQHKKTFERAGFRVEQSEDATSKVIASRDQVVAQMPNSEFAKLCSAVWFKMSIGNPYNLWEAWALPGSHLYSMMENKEYIYSHIVAVKP